MAVRYLHWRGWQCVTYIGVDGHLTHEQWQLGVTDDLGRQVPDDVLYFRLALHCHGVGVVVQRRDNDVDVIELALNDNKHRIMLTQKG